MYLYIHNKYTQHILSTNTFILDVINRLTALVYLFNVIFDASFFIGSILGSLMQFFLHSFALL